MPTYEYQCNKCKATYELRQGFDAATTHKCEECGKGTAKRVLYAPPVVFKGSGWYVTDSKGKSSAVSDSRSESAGESGSTTSEDSAAPAKNSEKKAPASDATAAS